MEGLGEAVAALDVPLDAETWYEIWQAGQDQEVP
jgi:predicted oxidoreductase